MKRCAFMLKTPKLFCYGYLVIDRAASFKKVPFKLLNLPNDSLLHLVTVIMNSPPQHNTVFLCI